MFNEKDYNLIVGLRIREIRESLDLSREKFSEKCDISPSFLADIERGKKSLSVKTLYKICDSCNISSDYIILGHKQGFEGDLALELLSSFNEDDMEQIITILSSIKKIKNS